MNSFSIHKVFLLLLLPALAACAPVVKEGQPTAVQSATILQPGQSVGQTFTARDRGLNGVAVYLSPDQPGAGEIRLRLRAGAQTTTDLAVGTLAAASVTAPGFYRFAFAPQSDSYGHDYYLLLDAQGDGRVRVGTAAGDTYLDGALYQNGNPVDAQMAFRLSYDPVELLMGLVALAVTWLQVLLVAVLLFVLPGWALLAWLLPNWSARSWGERLGLAVGLSLAVYPLLMLWTNVIGLRLGALYAWLPMVAAIGALVWRNRGWRPRQIANVWHRFGRDDLVLVVLVGLIVGVRFWVIRSLDVPMWGDSYQHTMITQLIVDHGGLFNSWEPYADLQTFTYHFGFHSVVAAFHWITGFDLPRATLWVGQILNVLAVLALYPLAVCVGGNRWAGIGAILLAGLLSPMPMYYVNWGRYTQLAGQVILPVAICTVWTVLEARARDWRLIGLGWIVLGGLAVTHYRILIFAILFFVAYFLLEAWHGRVRELVAKIFWLGIGCALLFLPWFIHAFAGKYFAVFASQMTTLPGESSAWAQVNSIVDLSVYLPAWLWLLLALSLGWGLWRRDKNAVIVALWWFILLLAANPQWLQLPGEGVLSNFALFIALYIPAGVLVGAAIGRFVGNLQPKPIWTTVLVSLFAVIGFLGVQQRQGDLHVQPSTLVTRPDLNAAAWIQRNTPSDARFLVNSFFAYGDTLIVGADGGWWLPLLADRQISVPPLNYGAERGPRPNYREWVNALPAEIAAKGIDSPSALAMMRERNIDFVYIGQQQGRVNYVGPTLEPSQLLASPYFHPIYHQDRVWIFEVVRPP